MQAHLSHKIVTAVQKDDFIFINQSGQCVFSDTCSCSVHGCMHRLLCWCYIPSSFYGGGSLDLIRGGLLIQRLYHMLFDPPDPIMLCCCWKARRHCWVSFLWTARLRWCASSKPAQLWKTCSSSHRMLTWPYFRCITTALYNSKCQSKGIHFIIWSTFSL